jgi:hypothetical protein
LGGRPGGGAPSRRWVWRLKGGGAAGRRGDLGAGSGWGGAGV